MVCVVDFFVFRVIWFSIMVLVLFVVRVVVSVGDIVVGGVEVGRNVFFCFSGDEEVMFLGFGSFDGFVFGIDGGYDFFSLVVMEFFRVL